MDTPHDHDDEVTPAVIPDTARISVGDGERYAYAYRKRQEAYARRLAETDERITALTRYREELAARFDSETSWLVATLRRYWQQEVGKRSRTVRLPGVSLQVRERAAGAACDVRRVLDAIRNTPLLEAWKDTGVVTMEPKLLLSAIRPMLHATGNDEVILGPLAGGLVGDTLVDPATGEAIATPCAEYEATEDYPAGVYWVLSADGIAAVTPADETFAIKFETAEHAQEVAEATEAVAGG